MASVASELSHQHAIKGDTIVHYQQGVLCKTAPTGLEVATDHRTRIGMCLTHTHTHTHCIAYNCVEAYWPTYIPIHSVCGWWYRVQCIVQHQRSASPGLVPSPYFHSQFRVIVGMEIGTFVGSRLSLSWCKAVPPHCSDLTQCRYLA